MLTILLTLMDTNWTDLVRKHKSGPCLSSPSVSNGMRGNTTPDLKPTQTTGPQDHTYLDWLSGNFKIRIRAQSDQRHFPQQKSFRNGFTKIVLSSLQTKLCKPHKWSFSTSLANIMASNRGYWFYKSIKITSETREHSGFTYYLIV